MSRQAISISNSTRLSPLALAVNELATLCEIVEQESEDTGTLSEKIKEMFAFSRENLASNIDRRKNFYRFVVSQIDHAKQREADWEKDRKRMERLAEALKEDTKTCLEQHPDLPWTDTFGKKVQLVNSSAPRLIVKSIGEIDFTVDEYQRFVKTKLETFLDKAAIKEALTEGEELPWASLERSQYVRGL